MTTIVQQATLGMGNWRPMVAADIAMVAAISDTVHGAYTEQAEIYAERLRLYPAGCWLLECDGEAQAYLISHPWTGDAPPELNALLTSMAPHPNRYYLHDLALLPKARGTGAAGQAVELAITQASAAGFDRIMLTAINGADAFWRKQGFTPLAYEGAAYGEGSLLMQRAVTNAAR